MTDAPNSVSEFGWRKPHPRRTPPWASLLPFFCRGAGSVPPRRGNVRFPCQFPLSPERFPHRVGADLCVRPDTPLHGTCSRADTLVGPYGFDQKPPSTPKNRAGTEPRPYRSITVRSSGPMGLGFGSRLRRKGPRHFSLRRVCGGESLLQGGVQTGSGPAGAGPCLCPGAVQSPSGIAGGALVMVGTGSVRRGRGRSRGDGVPARDQ